jgi:hypothetical protein
MKGRFLSAVAIAFSLAIGGVAKGQLYSSGQNSSTTYSSTTSLDPEYYTNVSGNRVHRPVFSSKVPSGATAQCVDGSYSFSQHARGTCSHHGGVAHRL